MISTDAHIATLSDHRMIVACMAMLKESGTTRQDAVPIYIRDRLKAEVLKKEQEGGAEKGVRFAYKLCLSIGEVRKRVLFRVDLLTRITTPGAQ